ncbi:uncharacterized protein FA14DRAFT_160841 [Meira miltonrushii]|uniref:Uncharacterized protein n=1 Tax=Meira miltonrushii TaxID=1280837 RepID=A0A316VDU6_9BASI|nr:uncharacterized protein FA14DRAFT_160841 [Meira miltonrushii]PWN35857.1 hypothetical protein FA14DRAFT_160841 [Meira miltonrushii]
MEGVQDTQNKDGGNVWRLSLTIVLLGIITLFFFRSILPRIPRLFFRGRLRIKRIGLRGIRGIEWQTQGFNSDSGSAPTSSRKRSSLSSLDGENNSTGGLGIKVRHVYLTLRWISGEDHSFYERSEKKDDSQPLGDGDEEPKPSSLGVTPKRNTALITVHIDGIGVNLPRKDDTNTKEKQGKQEERAKKEEEARKQAVEEEEEERLQALMSSRPSSPRPDAKRPDGKTNQTVSPMPAFSAAMGRAPRTPPETSSATVPFRSWNQWIAFIRYTLWPALCFIALRLFRSLAYLLFSILPLLSRVIDVEIRRVEVYAAEQDAVLRIQEMDLGAHMDVVPATGHSEVELGVEQEQKKNNLQERLASLLSLLHVSIGSGARGAATIALDGFPGLRANLRIAVHGVQMFDAARARHVRTRKSSEEGRTIERTPNTSSSFTLGSAQEHQWKSFSEFQNVTTSPNPQRGLHKAASEVNLFSEAKVDSRKRWAGRWTDWALEKTPNSDFMPHTSWDQGEPECKEQPIPANARLLAMQDITSFSVGFILGKAVSAKDSLHLSLSLAPVTIGGDAFVGMAERIQDEKAQRINNLQEPVQEPPKGSKSLRSSPRIAELLEMFGSISVSVPSVLVDMSSKSSFTALSAAEANPSDAYLPSSIQMLTEIAGFKLSITTSRLPDEMHQSFLGTCGLKNYKAAIARRALSGGLRWTLGRRRAAFVEHRRVFAFSASLAQVDVRLGIDGNRPQSKLMNMSDLSVKMRSSWTPIGLLIIGPSNACFAGDPNEQAVVLDAKMKSLNGNVKMQHLCSLLTFFRYRQAERLQYRQEIGVAGVAGVAAKEQFKEPKHHNSSQNESMMRQIPRFHIGIELSEMSYCFDASELIQIGNEKPTLDLMVEVPKVSFHAEGNYQDQCVRRSENERKAAWKALAKDELEWSLKPRSKLNNAPVDGSSISAATKPGGYFDWRRGSLSGASPRSPDSVESPPIPSPSETQNKPMTMNEALEKMRQIQEMEKNPKKSHKPRAHRGSIKKSHLSATSVNSPTHNLRCQSTCSFDHIKMFWVMDGHDISSQRRARDGEDRFPSFVDQMPLRGKTHRHVLALNDFEAVCSMSVPGDQELIGNHVTLMTDRRSIDVRTSLEEVDLDMWHTSSLDATRACLQAISNASKKVQLSEKDNGTEENNQESSPQESDDQNLPPLIDLLKPNSSLYFSVGTIVAHLGGSDTRCDPGMFRGIGVDIKRAIFQAAVAKLEPRKLNDPTHYSMGARSALDLPEDQRTSVTALAVRHGKAASVKLNVFQMGVFPLLDAQMATAQHIGGNGADDDSDIEHKYNFDADTFGSPSIIAPAVWDFQRTRPQHTKQHRLHARFRQQDRSNFILWVPKFALRANLVPKDHKTNKIGKHTEELQIVTEDSNLVSLKIEMLHTYCALVAIASLKSLKPTSPSKKSSDTDSKNDAKQAQKTKKKVTRKYQIPSYHAALRISDIQIAVALPSDVNLFIRIQHVELVHAHHGDSSIGFERLMCAVESPEVPSKGMWEELARMRDCKVRLEEGKEDGTPMRVKVNVDGISFRVPFNYTVHPIIDSTVVSVKTTKQLVHQFIKGGNDSVIIPVAEEAKHLPIIDVKVRIFSIEAEDDPFETRLNIIWRSGGDENQARSERESAFQEKVHALENLRTNDPSSETIATMTTTASESDVLEDDKLRRQAKVSIEEARTRLDAFNASSWARRFGNAQAEQARREEANVRRIYGRLPPHAMLQNDMPIKLAPRSRAAPLFRSTMTRLHIVMSPPSFPESKLRDFLYEQGDEIPRDMEYSLLIPLHMKLRMDEWKIDLRDYPMPLLHFPPINRNTQPDTLAAVELEMDFCIAEQLGSDKALRHISAIVVPAATGRPDAVEYGISVPRMSMPTKFYGSPVLNINSSYPTRLVWGQSVQPAIHDVIRVFEGITSPPHDPSPRIGFWDKMSLIMQGALKVQFPGDGQFHVYLKGSRDPYHILGHGAGWVKCWRGNVELRLGFENPQKEVFQILSDEYILAIPNLKDYIDRAAIGTESRDAEEESSSHGKNGPSSYKRAQSSNDALSDSEKAKHGGHKAPTIASSLASTHHRYMRDPEFKKICMKLTNGVRWGFGLILERTCTEDSCVQKVKCQGAPFYRVCRFWTRKKHWQVYTRSIEYVDTLPDDQKGDSFDGWRTHHLHFSVSIDSPRDGEDDRAGEHREDDRSKKSSTEPEPNANAVNNLYFTPLAWEHFWAWMRLFDSALSLPIRQGKLFPGSLEQSPKFGRHLGTIKYHFNIAPLLISHLYPQANKMDWARGRTTLIGVKARMATFHMDFHQRQQEIVVDRPELGGQRKTFHKPFYEAEVDLSNINFRTLAGQFQEPDKRLVPLQDVDENEDHDHDNIFFDGEDEDESGPSDRDLEWYDLHDFVELDWAPPEGGRQPRIRLIEAMSCPRFSYYRRIESKDERVQRTKGEKSPDDQDNNNETAKLENTKFGHENTHVCLVGIAPTPPKVQIALAEARLDILNTQLKNFLSKSGGEPLNEEFMGGEGRAKAETERAKKASSEEEQDLHKKIKLVREYIKLLSTIQHKVFDIDENHENEPEHLAHTSEGITEMPGSHSSLSGNDALHEWQAFDNRYFIHNPVIFYSNQTRDVLLKYYLSSRKRRGVVHSLSARAVRTIRDIGKEGNGEGEGKDVNKRESQHRTYSSSTGQTEEDSDEEEGTTPTPNATESKIKNRSRSASENLDGILKDAVEYMMPNDEGEKNEEGVQNGDEGRDKAWQAESRAAFAALMETCNPQEGISDEFEVRRSNVCVVLKPQIVLRSLVDDKSTVIITAARARLRNYSVKDPRVEEDSVNERVLYRNFMGVDALQGFHPSKKCSFVNNRARGSSHFVYVPLETLIDVKYETSDFDRICPRTDAIVQYDKFNKLRLNDPNHPVAASNSDDEKTGEDDVKDETDHSDHLRHTMDLIKVHCPRYSVSANADQFGAIYNVVTDLLLYRDPAYREHAKKLEVMMFSYDLSDVEALADLVQSLQIRIRHARELHSQYELHFELLNDQGRLDFLGLKAEINDMQDELNLLLEAITQADDNSDKEKKSALRLEANARDVAWNMMGNKDGELLAKMSIRSVNYVWMNKADNSVQNSLTVGDLNAVNVDPNAVFQEIITKYNSPDHHPMKENGMLLIGAWSVLPPVGGIAIVDHFELHLHPLRIQIERKIGRQIEEYIFGSMREKRKEREEIEDQGEHDQKGDGKGDQKSIRGKGILTKRFKQLKGAISGHGHSSNSKDQNGEHDQPQEEEPSPTQSGQSSPRKATKPLPSDRKSIEGRRSMNLHRTSSRSLLNHEDRSKSLSYYGSSGQLSNSTNKDGGGGENGGDGGGSDGESEEESGQRAIASRNAIEMRERASKTVTFVSVKVSQTIFCLSYKSEKQKSIVDLYDLVFKSPKLEYRNRTWAHADLANHLKRDIIKAAWRQRSTLIKGVISHRKPPATQRVAQAAMTLTRSRNHITPLSGSNGQSPTSEMRNALTGAIEYPLKKAASLTSSSSLKKSSSNSETVHGTEEGSTSPNGEPYGVRSDGDRQSHRSSSMSTGDGKRKSSSTDVLRNRRKSSSSAAHDDRQRISSSSEQRRTPEFRLLVDPPSFSTTDSHGSLSSNSAAQQQQTNSSN